MDESDCIKIHLAIHDGSNSVTTSDGKKWEITTSAKAPHMRKTTVYGTAFMEQNKTKGSIYATRANQGHKLTWILYQRKWGLLCDNRVEIYCPFIQKEENVLEKLGKEGKRKKDDDDDDDDEEDDDGDDKKDDDDDDDDNDEGKRKKDKKSNKRGKGKAPASKNKEEEHVMQLTIQYPKYWKAPVNKIERVEVSPSSKEFIEVQQMFDTTVAPQHKSHFRYSKLRIKKLERFQHPQLYAAYFLRREAVISNNKRKPEDIKGVLTKKTDDSSNEHYLFHGLNFNVLEKILEEGFDERVASLRGMFGSGIYFAENASKSVQYSHSRDCSQVGAVYASHESKCTCMPKNNVERSILLCRVVLGSPWIRLVATDSENPLRRPPVKPSGAPYDSVMGECKKWDKQASLMFREYIIYDRQQSYPEYICTYECVA